MLSLFDMKKMLRHTLQRNILELIWVLAMRYFYITFREQIEQEINFKKCLDILGSKNIKIYAKVRRCPTLVDTFSNGSEFIMEESCRLFCMHILKKSSSNRVITKKNGKTYIKVCDGHYLGGIL